MRSQDSGVVFLICSERSGSNLIRVMVGNHSRITAPPPLHLARDVGANLHAVIGAGRDAPAWDAMRTLIRGRVAKHYGDDAGHDVVRELDALPELTFERIIKTVFAVIHPDAQSGILFIKENNVHEHVFFLLRIFPDARFIFQVRDPRDYVASAKERKKGLFGNKFGSLRRCMEIWRADQLGGLKLLSHLGSERVHVQRYEDLVSDPTRVLTSLCDFVGLRFEESMLAFHEREEVQQFAQKAGAWENLRKPIMSNNFGKYREKLSKWQIRVVETALGPIMERFGYQRDLTRPGRVSTLLALWPGITETLERWFNEERAPFYWDGKQVYDERIESLALPLAIATATTSATPTAPSRAATRAAGHVLERIARAASEDRRRPALSVRGETWSYDELLAEAAAIATALREDARPGESPVAAVVASRSFSAYAGVLGILLSGRTYVPVNPVHPPERIRSILARSGASAVVCGADSREELDGILAECAGDAPRVVSCPDARRTAPSPTGWDAQLGAWRAAESESANPYAYVLFTSGSTGVPKGVRISHGNLEAYLDAVEQLVEITPQARFSQTFDLTFDLSVHDLFVSWTHGAHLMVATHEELRKADAYIERNEITHWFSVPSLAFQLQGQGALDGAHFSSLRWSLFCGEGLPLDLALKWAAAAPESVVENWYGPTEATISCTRHRVRRTDAERDASPRGLVAIGTPFPGTRVLIGTPDLEPSKPGDPGELLLHGPQVAEGYLNDPERTARSFVQVPGEQGVFYRTGDRVVRDDRGDLHYLDRLDNQVKVRGYRIDLGEIEAALRDAVGGLNAIAVPWPVGATTPTSLAAAIEGAIEDEQAVLTSVRATLPEYMVPSHLIALESFPKNASGKADRKQVASILKERVQETVTHDPGFAAGTARRKLWDALATVENVVVSERLITAETLFDGGLDSLGFLALVARIEPAFDVELGEQDVTALSMMSFDEMASALGERGALDQEKHRVQGRIVRVVQFLARFPDVLANATKAPCVVVGSSGAFRGIDPVTFDAVAAAHGVTVPSYNVGLPGISCAGIARVCEFIRDQFAARELRAPCIAVEVDVMQISVNPPSGDMDLEEDWLTRPNKLILEKDVGEFTWTSDNAGDSASKRAPKRRREQARWERKRDGGIIEAYAGNVEFDAGRVASWLRAVAALREISDRVVAFVHPIGAADELRAARDANDTDRYQATLAQLEERSGVRILADDAFRLETDDFLNLNHANPGGGREKLTRQLAEQVLEARRADTRQA